MGTGGCVFGVGYRSLLCSVSAHSLHQANNHPAERKKEEKRPANAGQKISRTGNDATEDSRSKNKKTKKER